MRPRTSSALLFTVQTVLALASVSVLFLPHGGFPLVARIGGALFALAGLILITASYRALGKSHSPGSMPIKGAVLVTDGPYSYVRHPVYLGYILAGFGGATLLASVPGLCVAVLVLVYYDLRTRFEDRQLAATYPDFDVYRRRVRGRLIPKYY